MPYKSEKAIKTARTWFRADKYVPMASCGPLRWLEQIHKRVHIDRAFERGDKTYLDDVIPRLIADPLAPHLVESEHWSSLDKQDSPPVVRSLDLHDVERIQKIVEQGAQRLVSTPKANLTQLQLRPAATGSTPPAIEGYLVVRLDSTNAEIIKGVSAWLKERRRLTPEVVLEEWADAYDFQAEVSELVAASPEAKNLAGASDVKLQLAATQRKAATSIRNIRPRSTDLMLGLQSHFDWWHEKQIVAYYDLTAWSKWSGLKLSDTEKWTLLFDPDGSDKEPDVKKTKTLAREVFCTENLSQLFYLGIGKSAK
jgi:hypothetical protein